jgi:hypothetical protein
MQCLFSLPETMFSFTFFYFFEFSFLLFVVGMFSKRGGVLSCVLPGWHIHMYTPACFLKQIENIVFCCVRVCLLVFCQEEDFS